MDRLEQFITENRESFDDAIPSLKAWAAIDRRINQKQARRIQMWKNLRIAAAVLVLLVAGGVAGNFLAHSNSSAGATAILEESAPEYFEMEQYFQQEIDRKVAQLASYEPNSPVIGDLKQIDQAMRELKKELATAPKGQEQEIIENLIQNYQMKIAILERVLERIKHNSNQENLKTKDDEISI